MSRQFLLAALVAGSATLASTAHAGGFGIPEIGVRRTAMARGDRPARRAVGALSQPRRPRARRRAGASTVRDGLSLRRHRVRAAAVGSERRVPRRDARGRRLLRSRSSRAARWASCRCSRSPASCIPDKLVAARGALRRQRDRRAVRRRRRHALSPDRRLHRRAAGGARRRVPLQRRARARRDRRRDQHARARQARGVPDHRRHGHQRPRRHAARARARRRGVGADVDRSARSVSRIRA